MWRIDCPLTPLLKGIHDFPKLHPQSGLQSFLVRLLGGQPPALFLLSQAKQIHWATIKCVYSNTQSYVSNLVNKNVRNTLYHHTMNLPGTVR